MSLSLKQFEKDHFKLLKIVEKLESTGLPWIQRYIIANDQIHAEYITKLVKAKKLTPLKAVNCIGSFSRFDWALEHLKEKDFFRLLPELWVGSDPDDSILRLPIWEKAVKKNGGYITDSTKKLSGKKKVYRGQSGDHELGISWSLKKSIATKFAHGTRGPIKNGSVYIGVIDTSEILAYLTSRDEEEIIVDPRKVKITNIEVL